ncbi:MAG: hypothetical protein HY726_03695 [Candidatus Rokubacteria bacterium]|nr:hypothetical protein [Candidatus Rokubacteria bacterium]
MARILFVVTRNRPDLFDRLTEWFSEVTDAQVIFDRRQGQRRNPAQAHEPERRRGDRRRRLGIEAELRSHGFVLVRGE